MAITISAALQTLQDNLKDDLPDLTANTNRLMVQWANWIDYKIYHTLWKNDPERYMSESSISVVSWTSAYSLAADFRSIDAISAWLYPLDWNSNITLNGKLTVTAPWSQRLWYYIDKKNDNIEITPLPWGAVTYTLRYIPALTAHTAVANSMLLDEEWSQALNAVFEALYEAWKRSPNTAFADEMVVRALDDLLDNFNSAPGVLDLGNISLSYA